LHFLSSNRILKPFKALSRLLAMAKFTSSTTTATTTATTTTAATTAALLFVVFC